MKHTSIGDHGTKKELAFSLFPTAGKLKGPCRQAVRLSISPSSSTSETTQQLQAGLHRVRGPGQGWADNPRVFGKAEPRSGRRRSLDEPGCPTSPAAAATLPMVPKGHLLLWTPQGCSSASCMEKCPRRSHPSLWGQVLPHGEGLSPRDGKCREVDFGVVRDTSLRPLKMAFRDANKLQCSSYLHRLLFECPYITQT